MGLNQSFYPNTCESNKSCLICICLILTAIGIITVHNQFFTLEFHVVRRDSVDGPEQNIHIRWIVFQYSHQIDFASIVQDDQMARLDHYLSALPALEKIVFTATSRLDIEEDDIEPSLPNKLPITHNKLFAWSEYAARRYAQGAKHGDIQVAQALPISNHYLV